VLVDEGGDGGCILANTAIERISTFEADHDDSQILLVEEGIDVPEELFDPILEENRVFQFIRHEVPALPMIVPRPELGVIHLTTRCAL